MEIGVSFVFRDASSALFVDNTSNLTNSSSIQCDALLDDSNLQDGRIPAVLGINVGTWMMLMMLFIIIRYCATDYSRVGLAATRRWPSALYNRKTGTLLKDEQHLDFAPVGEDRRFYTWIPHFFRLSDRNLRLRCGPDASLYLSLQRHLIVLLSFYTVFSLLVILPINYFTGNLQTQGFARTTISNIEATKGVLWVHTFFSLIYLILAVVSMIHYSLQLGKLQQQYSTHTAMIQWVPKYVHREDMLQHFQEALPHTLVADVQMAYDVSKLTKLSDKLTRVKCDLESVESVRLELGEEEKVRVGWRKLCCWRDDYLVDARSYYEDREQDLNASIEREAHYIRQKRLGIGFATFTSKDDATDFLTSYKLCRRKPQSSLYQSIKARWWWVSIAPFPLDILWENLSVHYVVWWLRWLLINSILFVILFFFTTPAIVVASIDEIRIRLHLDNAVNITGFTQVDPLVKVYVSNLLLLFFASLMPFLVARSCFLEAHWTKSVREQTIMRKTYIFLVLMIILLPSIGLASLNAAGELALKGQEAVRERLQCVYLPNNGAFFIAYVITSAFVGTAMELLRVPELAEYVYRRWRAKTRLQKEQALKKAAQYDFMYGVQYAWSLVIFTVVVAFSLTTPAITPFGVLYFILKYYTDKYNIYYVYRPASFRGKQFLHRSALRFVIVGAIHLQVSTLFFSIIRLGGVDPRTILLMIALSLTILLCIGAMSFSWFSHLLPKLRVQMGKEYRVFSSTRGNTTEEEEEVIAKGTYIPPVLKDLPQDIPSDNSVDGYQSFGSTDHMGRRSPSANNGSGGSSPSRQSDSPPTSKIDPKDSNLGPKDSEGGEDGIQVVVKKNDSTLEADVPV